MLFSKTFGYAVRGVLYIALMQDEKKFVHVEEIAEKLHVPRHFMAKIMKQLGKAGVLHSVKGPMGGFSINEKTLKLPLVKLVHLVDGKEIFNSCVLRMKECNRKNPCPLHPQMEIVKNQLIEVLAKTQLGELLHENKTKFISSLSAGLAGPEKKIQK